jgi:hypothetical protein
MKKIFLFLILVFGIGLFANENDFQKQYATKKSFNVIVENIVTLNDNVEVKYNNKNKIIFVITETVPILWDKAYFDCIITITFNKNIIDFKATNIEGIHGIGLMPASTTFRKRNVTYVNVDAHREKVVDRLNEIAEQISN